MFRSTRRSAVERKPRSGKTAEPARLCETFCPAYWTMANQSPHVRSRPKTNSKWSRLPGSAWCLREFQDRRRLSTKEGNIVKTVKVGDREFRARHELVPACAPLSIAEGSGRQGQAAVLIKQARLNAIAIDRDERLRRKTRKPTLVEQGQARRSIKWNPRGFKPCLLHINVRLERGNGDALVREGIEVIVGNEVVGWIEAVSPPPAYFLLAQTKIRFAEFRVHVEFGDGTGRLE